MEYPHRHGLGRDLHPRANWSGMASTAFITDDCSPRIVVCRTTPRPSGDTQDPVLGREGCTDDQGRLKTRGQHSNGGIR